MDGNKFNFFVKSTSKEKNITHFLTRFGWGQPYSSRGCIKI